MSLSPILDKLAAGKTIIGAVIIAGAIYAALAKVAALPTKFDAHMAQTDTVIRLLTENNHLQRQSICIQAHVQTPLQCLTPLP